MDFVNLIALMFALCVAIASAAPGGWWPKHKHVIIHVPYDVHTVHHHHVKKVHVPVIKEKILIKHVPEPVYIPVHHEPIHHHHEPIHHHHEPIISHGWEPSHPIIHESHPWD